MARNQGDMYVKREDDTRRTQTKKQYVDLMEAVGRQLRFDPLNIVMARE